MAYTIIFKHESEIVKTHAVNGKWSNALDVLNDFADHYRTCGCLVESKGTFPINPSKPYLGNRMSSFAVQTKVRELFVYIKKAE